MTAPVTGSLFASEEIRGIDVHVHARTKPVPGRRGGTGPSFADLTDTYRRLRLCAIVFDVDNRSVSGVPMRNDAVAEVVARAPDMLIGFCSVDPWAGKAGVREIRRCATLLRDKCLFGSDYPMIDVERWLAEFDELEIREDVRPRIMLDNARRLLGIQP